MPRSLASQARYIAPLLFVLLFIVAPAVYAAGPSAPLSAGPFAPLGQEPDPVIDGITEVLDRLPPISIGGIALFGMVVSLVQLARNKLGLASQYALPLAVVLVLASYGVLVLLAVNPALQDAVIGILQLLGLLIGLIGGPKVTYHAFKGRLPGFGKG